MIKWRKVYPHVYEDDEQELLSLTMDFISGGAEELEKKLRQQDIDFAEGREYPGGMELSPGTGLKRDFTAGSNDLLASAYALNPYNPLYTNPSYKNKYGRLVANPLFGDPACNFPYIPKGTDIWISSDDPCIGRGLDHKVTFHKPILAGDTLRTRVTRQDCVDITEPGSMVRRFRVIGEHELYNQRDELVSDGWYSAIETFKIPEKPEMAAEYEGPKSIAFNMYADWDKVRPRHVYTDEDWEQIKSVWENEEIRGADARYWEDVNIGDEPRWTCEAPVLGMGPPPMLNVSRTTSLRDVMMDTEFEIDSDSWRRPKYTEPYKDEYGRYRVDEIRSTFNPRQLKTDDPNARNPFMNTSGRNFCTRLVTNWIGDEGFLHKICWKLAFCWEEGKNAFPLEHDRPSYLYKVPYLAEQGRFMLTHGYEGDCSITKAYVCDKYVKDGKHYIDLVVWCETIDGHIWSECYAVVELPSRERRDY